MPAFSLDELPVEPADLVVLAVGVVVPRCVRRISSPETNIGTPCETEQDRGEVLDLPARAAPRRRVVGLALDAAVPAQVLVDPVAVVLAVRLVVLVVVGDEVVEREAVVAR